MAGVKIRLPINYYALIAVKLDKTVKESTSPDGKTIIDHSVMAALTEVRKTIVNSIVVKYFDENSAKKVNKTFTESQCLLLFHTFYGAPLEGFTKVVFNDMLMQIETQLFKSGKYQLLSY